MVRREGLEPPTPWFEARYSIQLSYRRMWRNNKGNGWKRQRFFLDMSFNFSYDLDVFRMRELHASVAQW